MTSAGRTGNQCMARFLYDAPESSFCHAARISGNDDTPDFTTCCARQAMVEDRRKAATHETAKIRRVGQTGLWHDDILYFPVDDPVLHGQHGFRFDPDIAVRRECRARVPAPLVAGFDRNQR